MLSLKKNVLEQERKLQQQKQTSADCYLLFKKSLQNRLTSPEVLGGSLGAGFVFGMLRCRHPETGLNNTGAAKKGFKVIKPVLRMAIGSTISYLLS